MNAPHFFKHSVCFLLISISLACRGQEGAPKQRVEKDADLILYREKPYTFEEAMADLPKILEATNSVEKKHWLYRVISFRSKFQGQGVALLGAALAKERDPEVREAILHVIQYSRDERFNEICAAAANDPSPR